jgi:rhodanese-related sulfurtransferase
MATIFTTAELKQKIDSGSKDFYLVDVLAPASFEARHVPGALGIPKGVDFVERFEKETHAPKDAEIIVYCSSDTCGASVQSAAALEQAGYTNVAHYKDGLAGWQNAGLAFASGN